MKTIKLRCEKCGKEVEKSLMADGSYMGQTCCMQYMKDATYTVAPGEDVL